ncbi:PREDICTED: RING finger and transmembrane domain-containing protein 2 isoform X2 [Papilio xuthus]|uniref:RING finger and transmembrane domain-containing protein 2 isoform X2 n=1 Tax=Papilio xuthus TaxID=66420 RepID=A0AAJ7EEJ5_PAPXU|nr:PREDICTED: RING finger and transmembrane domain-containing protein 2 isoform X2 [Papilio xuthus]
MAQTNQINLDIEDDPPNESPNRNIPIQRMDSTSRQPVPRSNIGLGDRLNSVFREIRPLVEHARMGNNARLSLPTWLPRNTPGTHQTGDGVQRPQSSIAHVNLGPASQTYVVTERGTPLAQRSQSTTHGVSASPSNNSNISEQGQENQEVNVPVNPSNNNNVHDNADNDSQSDDLNQQVTPLVVLDMRAALNFMIRYAPFYLILFIKLIYDSREGIFTFCVLFCTFTHCNSLVRREHGKQANRSILALFCELVFTVCCIGVVHFLFGHGKLLPNVIMFPGYTEPIDVWELLWLVILTDLVVKIVTVDVKILVTMMPAFLLPFQKRGKVYLFTEAVSQLYRALLTIQPWVFFLMQSYEGSEKMVGMFLTSIYVIAKVVEVLVRLRLFKNATWTLLQSVNLGTKPTGEQLVSAGDSCPICHDDYTTPVRLGCSHIFCELCISAWLDREHTCPLCRAKVADEPTWRDGSTTHDFQLY